MRGFENNNRPEKSEYPDVLDAVKVGRLDDVGWPDQPIEGREMGSAIVGGERCGCVGCGVCHFCLPDRFG